MKVQKLVIKNIGAIVDETILLNKPLILFYGEIRQGKSTILNAVRWVCGGSFPSDIIRHGQKEASIELEFDGGMVSRSFYKDKKGETAARPLIFIRNGKPVGSPATEVKRFLNPFLLNQDHLKDMTETERKAYFTELFAVDTTALDTEWFNNDRTASNLRVEIKTFGEIDLTPVEPVDASALRLKLNTIRGEHDKKVEAHNAQIEKLREAHSAAVSKVQAENVEVERHNTLRVQRQDRHTELSEEIAELNRKLAAANASLQSVAEWLKENPAKKPAALPVLGALPAAPAQPDVSDLEQKIQDAGATNVRAEQFKANKARAEQKNAKAEQVVKLEQRQREIKAEKVALLKGVSDESGIAELSFDEDGTFTYQGTQAGMLSTSQIMRLSSELSSMYPDGFGIELLDRGESLGKSVFEYVDRAKKEGISILATIVGERPAKVPDDIGVFVVKDGKVSP